MMKRKTSYIISEVEMKITASGLCKTRNHLICWSKKMKFLDLCFSGCQLSENQTDFFWVSSLRVEGDGKSENFSWVHIDGPLALEIHI